MKILINTKYFGVALPIEDDNIRLYHWVQINTERGIEVAKRLVGYAKRDRL